MRNLKKLGIMTISMMLAAAAVTGCGSSDKNASTKNQTKTETEADNAAYADSGEIQLGEPQSGDTIATFHIKNYGDITVRLFSKAAPKAVDNFVTHAKEGYYDGVIFHRVIDDFMIQGGEPEGTGAGGESIWGKAFEDEFAENLMPIRGALCMANAGADTNGSQFFIVQAKEAEPDSDSIEEYLADKGVVLTDEQKQMFVENGGTPHLVYGHTVFGQVIDGMDVVDAISASKTDASDRPISDVIIESIDITIQE